MGKRRKNGFFRLLTKIPRSAGNGKKPPARSAKPLNADAPGSLGPALFTYKSAELKAPGKSSAIKVFLILPFRFAKII